MVIRVDLVIGVFLELDEMFGMEGGIFLSLKFYFFV